MTTTAASTARGTIIKVPDSTPGLLFVEGQQASFTLEGCWRSPVAPAANMTVDVQFDPGGAIGGIAAVGPQQLARERLDRLSGIAQRHGRAAAQIAWLGVGALAIRMGRTALAATAVLWVGWFFLPAISIASFGAPQSYTLWQALALDWRSPLTLLSGSRGLWAVAGLLAIASPVAVPFFRHARAHLLNAAPLVFLGLTVITLRWDISRAFGPPAEAAGGALEALARDMAARAQAAFLEAISFELGAWAIGGAALLLAAHAFKPRARAAVEFR